MRRRLAVSPSLSLVSHTHTHVGGRGSIVVDSSGAVYWGTPNGLRRREPNAGPDASTGAGVTVIETSIDARIDTM